MLEILAVFILTVALSLVVGLVFIVKMDQPITSMRLLIALPIMLLESLLHCESDKTPVSDWVFAPKDV